MVAGTRREFLRFAGSAAVSVVSISTLAASVAEAATLTCGRPQVPVRVDASLPEPVLDNSQPQRAIQAMAPAGYHGGRTIGLYSAEVAAKIETRFSSVWLTKSSPACLSLTAVHVGITMPTRRIYVSSELSPGTCQHNAILGHERKHEATDDIAVHKHAPHIQGAIHDAVAKLGPIEASAGGHDAAQAHLTKMVQSAFDRAWAAFLAERSDAQRQVDAGLEYARVAASCPDWSQLRE